ncbi:MAG: hypothetical protein ABI995_14505, partial [Acidobacteriota bacterium]
VQAGLDSVAALALDAAGNVYAAGSYRGSPAFPATAGAFQSAPQPVVPALGSQSPSGGGLDVFVAKWDRSLTHLLAATLLGGESTDAPTSIALDGSGMVIVAGYSDSRAFPTHAPFQESFSSRTGFLAGLDANLSNLLFSTFAGDGRPFAVQAAVPDGKGGVLLAGSSLRLGGSVANDSAFADIASANQVFVNRINLPAAPGVRLDSVQNFASKLAVPLAPGEPIVAVGAGFGTGSQIVMDGVALASISGNDTSIVAAMPDSGSVSGLHTVRVSKGGTLSNFVYAPAASSAPAIYSADGSGAGQGYILNSDGTRNSPTNPAAAGSAITIFIAGVGRYSLFDGYAVTALPSATTIGGFYCYGIAAKMGPVDGLPGNVYQLSVYIPDPAVLAQNNADLKNFKFPAQSAIQIKMLPDAALGNVTTLSQNGLFVSIR